MRGSANEALMRWVIDTIDANRGWTTLIDICKHIWKNHGKEIQDSGEDFYTWQFDVRHAVKELRSNGIIRLADITLEGVWVLEITKSK